MGFTEDGVRLMQGVRLIWGPLNTGFTVPFFYIYLPKVQKANQCTFLTTAYVLSFCLLNLLTAYCICVFVMSEIESVKLGRKSFSQS